MCFQITHFVFTYVMFTFTRDNKINRLKIRGRAKWKGLYIHCVISDFSLSLLIKLFFTFKLKFIQNLGAKRLKSSELERIKLLQGTEERVGRNNENFKFLFELEESGEKDLK